MSLFLALRALYNTEEKKENPDTHTYTNAEI